MAERLFGTPEEVVKGLCEFCRFNRDHPCDCDAPSEEPLPDDYEVCGTCGFDHSYDGCNPAVYAEIKRLHAADEAAERREANVAEYVQGDRRALAVNPDVDYEFRLAEQQHNIACRLAEMAEANAKLPRYWLCEPHAGYGGRVFVLTAAPLDGDPSWMRHLSRGDDTQLTAAFQACRKLSRYGADKREEVRGALWLGYEFSDSPAQHRGISTPGDPRSDWDRIKALMVALLGSPGKWPE